MNRAVLIRCVPALALSAGLALFAITCLGACKATSEAEPKARAMQSNSISVWDVISRLGEKMPLSKAKVEGVLPVQLELKVRTQYLSHWVGGSAELAGGVHLSAVHLVLDPNDQFDATSGLTLELDGTCLALADVRSHYPELVQTDAPRGRSPEELSVWTSTQGWGRIAFGFKAQNPACVFSVSVNPPARP